MGNKTKILFWSQSCPSKPVGGEGESQEEEEKEEEGGGSPKIRYVVVLE